MLYALAFAWGLALGIAGCAVVGRWLARVGEMASEESVHGDCFPIWDEAPHIPASKTRAGPRS